MRFRKSFFLSAGLCLILILTGLTIRLTKEVAAARQIERMGGYVTFIYHGPDWLVKRLGNAYPCKSPLEIALMGTNITDGDLSVVGSFKQTRMVLLNAAGVRGPGLAKLKELPKLEEVVLTASAVTDEGLAYLTGLQTIKRLSLARTKITDQGLSRLEHLKKLEDLDLEDTKVSDLGLHSLSELPLKRLNVRKTMVTSEGIAQLKKNNPTVEIVQ